MSALVCIKVNTRWKVYEKHYEMEAAPKLDGPDELEECRAENTVPIKGFRRLQTALTVEVGARNYDYLHIWQQGKWRTICMN